ncbi:MAG: helix-turn-helix domain-containing protein [Verrucomicrobiota bacterium]
MQTTSQSTITRRWLTYELAEIYSGIGARTLQNHIRAGHIRSSNACAPGATRGRRLIDRESLDAFIEAGVGAPMTQLAMNSGGATRA